MLTKGDEYPIHQTPDPIAFSGTDRNFYDRYFFNGQSADGKVFFAVALAVYPHLNIIDAGFAIRIGDQQYNLHASRHLNMERMDTHVGPIRIEVLEPLQRLRIVVEDNEHGIAADLTFTGRVAPIEEPRTVRRNGPRIVQDLTRMTQFGRYSGWVRAGGHEIKLADTPMYGVRDRSWGVRHVGLRDPQQPVNAQEFQVYWHWLPVHFADRVLLFFINEDGDGKVWNRGLVMAHDNGDIEHLHGGRITVDYVPGTRFIARCAISAVDDEGARYSVNATTGDRFYMSGIGYMHPDWGHGFNKGPLAVAYDSFSTRAITRYEAPYQHLQAFADVVLTLPDGTTMAGTGCLESIIMGRHNASGLTSLYDVP